MVKVAKKSILADDTKKEAAEKILSRMGRQSEEEQASGIAKENNLPYVDLNLVPVSSDDIFIISEEEARALKITCFHKGGKDVKLAILNPSQEKLAEYIQKLQTEEGFSVSLYVASKTSLEKVWSRYKENPILESLDLMQLSLSGKDLEDFEKKFKDLLELKTRIREIPTTQIIETMMGGAIKMGASDIHFEPQQEEMRLRYRIDGMLQDVGYFPLETYKSVVSRIKMMAMMKINLRDIAQDGHFSITLDQNRIDVRVNIIPGKYGESIVMRLLDQANVTVKVEELGLKGLAYEVVQKQIEKPTGMILVTGPTGSGKTTTLYALINKLNTPDLKIITIEDPVEYEIKGISQTQVNKGRGYDFGSGLRAIVRQDPDVILVGEIRDEETAEISINAALTGHLVLSTIHTNSASATVPRFLELGVKPSLIPPAINAFIAQRLVRKLCLHCREEYVPAQETVGTIKRLVSIISPKAKVDIPRNIEKLYRAKGCPKCHNLGYKGRIGIFEVLTINEDIQKLILEMAGEDEIMRAALENGMITMAQDGILKAVEGITSMDEVLKATGQVDFLEELYSKLMEQSLSRAITIPEEIIKKIVENSSSFEKINTLSHAAEQKELAKYILGSAMLLSAGDIHIEPGGQEVKVRFRIDGMLQNIISVPLNEYPTFLGEIKLLSGFKTESRGGVKDGRFSIVLENPPQGVEDRVDVRVSIILGGFGETVVMRILSKSAVGMDLQKLGIRKQTLEKIMAEIKKPTGVFLNTGPTGSGKTTTLYSILGILNKPTVKIITVEDPIEYQLEGILQTQANDKEGYTFATALRALMRQNPDIIMIGEIRDQETAAIAVQSALTGHLVLSTLHTNDSSSSIQRLINMGIRSDDLATAANAFMAQRLVRKLCDCKQKEKPTAEEKKTIEKILKTVSLKSGVEKISWDNIFKPKGCEKCNNIGYKGRVTISELLPIDIDIQKLISTSALSSDIESLAVANGMITMAQDGILKVVEGETTLEEVERVVKL